MFIETPLGPMIALADKEGLCQLEFTDQKETSDSDTDQAHRELALYFARKLQSFTVPLSLYGTAFQIQVWEELQKIPFGQTRSYLDIAIAIGRPKAYRAVAQACGANNIPIIIPCHRVINANGALGGYNSGLDRKKWLLSFEQI